MSARPYFAPEHPEHRRRLCALVAAGRLWNATPFFAHSSAPGPDGGVDCVHLAAALLAAAGFRPPGKIPRFSMDWADHRETSPLLCWLRERPEHFAELAPDVAAIMPGDCLCFRLGRVPHHLGVAMPRRQLMHALQPYGAAFSPLDDSAFSKALAAIFRPLEQ